MTPQRKTAARERQPYFSRYTWGRDSLAKRVRICRGLLQYAILDLVRQRTEGRVRDDREAIPEWTDQIVWADVARAWGCTAAALRIEAEDGVKRGLWESRPEGKGVNLRPLLADEWEHVQDIDRRRLKLVEKETDAEPETAEELAKKAASREEVKPFTVREGKPGPVRNLDVPASSLSLSVQGGTAEVSGVRQGPHLTLTVKVASSKVNNLRSTDATTVASAASPPRTFSRREPAEPPHAAGRAAARAGESIPSAEREALRDGLGLGADVAMVRTLYGILRKGGGDAQEFVRFVDAKRRQKSKPILNGLLPTLAREFVDGGGTVPKDPALALLEQSMAEKEARKAAKAAGGRR